MRNLKLAARFSRFDQILLTPLPVPSPEQLINLGAPGPKPGMRNCQQAGDCDVVKNEPMVGKGVLVSGSYFPTLQVRAAQGRLLTQADDRVVSANYVTVLGHAFWKDKFGSDPNAVGQSMIINGRSFTIVSVVPEAPLQEGMSDQTMKRFREKRMT